MTLPSESPVFQALRRLGFTTCRASDGLGGPIKVRSADYNHRDLCTFPDFDNLPEQVPGGAGHGIGIPWNDDVRKALGLPGDFKLSDDPGFGSMSQWLRYLSRGGQMAWQWLADKASQSHDLSIQIPAVVEPNSGVTVRIGGSTEILRVTAKLPPRMVPSFPTATLHQPRVPVTLLERVAMFETDGTEGEGSITVTARDPSGGSQAVWQAFVVQEATDDPDPKPDPQPEPEPQPDPEPEPEPDAESEVCALIQDALRKLERAKELLCQ